ncbi:MAG TPA: Rho termination factor [Leeuwenhoekiella sp.]|nr:Rho termination factor [Leeuwenhoekiella sp.]
MVKNTRPSIKNEEQYDALIEQDYSQQKAARIANTPNAGEKGGHAEDYEKRTKEELYAQAKKVGISGRSKMTKQELINALRNN